MEETSFTSTPIPVTWEQLGILVLDASASMASRTKAGNLSKAKALNNAIKKVFTLFKNSKYSKQFHFSLVYFGDNAAIKMPITRADVLDDNGDYDPLLQGVDGCGTEIGKGLVLAKGIAEDFLKIDTGDGVFRSVIIIVLSDGQSEETNTLTIAESIKENAKITICSTMLESSTPKPIANQLLQNIVSDPLIDYRTTYDEETIMDFFNNTASWQGNEI